MFEEVVLLLFSPAIFSSFLQKHSPNSLIVGILTLVACAESFGFDLAIDNMSHLLLQVNVHTCNILFPYIQANREPWSHTKQRSKNHALTHGEN